MATVDGCPKPAQTGDRAEDQLPEQLGPAPRDRLAEVGVGGRKVGRVLTQRFRARSWATVCRLRFAVSGKVHVSDFRPSPICERSKLFELTGPGDCRPV